MWRIFHLYSWETLCLYFFSWNKLPGFSIRILLTSRNDLEVFLISLFSERVCICLVLYIEILGKIHQWGKPSGFEIFLVGKFLSTDLIFKTDLRLFRICIPLVFWKFFSRNISISSKLPNLLGECFFFFNFVLSFKYYLWNL